MDKIKKSAKKFIKELKGNIGFNAVAKYLISFGYQLEFYNSDSSRDKILKEEKLWDYALTRPAFTAEIRGKKYVFINDANNDKLISIVHEAGHFILGHTLENEHIANYTIQEMEANTFAHFVLSYEKPKLRLPSVICIIIAMLLLFAGIDTAYDKTTPDNAVYVTRSGKKYHRENCMYVAGRDCSALTIEQAQKEYEPCKVCNP